MTTPLSAGSKLITPTDGQFLGFGLIIPPALQKSNQVKVSGPAPNVENAVQALKARVEELHQSEEDRVSLS